MSIPGRALILGACLLSLGAVSCSQQAPEYSIVNPADGVVRIPVAQVDDGDAHFFTFRMGEKNINFFARTDAGGTLRTHFDACYTCYKYKRGYYQEGRTVVCEPCRISFDLDQEVWDWVGPCVPVTLKSRVEDGDLVIAVAKLERGGKLF